MSRPASPTPRTALIVAFGVIYVVWGSTYLAIRVAVQTLPPFLLAGARFVVAGAILAAWLAATRGFRPTRRQWLDNTIVGALLLVGGNGIVVWAEQKIPSGLASLIISVAPFFFVLFDWMLPHGRRPSLATLTGLVLGFAGLALLIGPGSLTTGRSLDLPRVAGLLIGCACWAGGSVYSRFAHRPAEPLAAATLQMLCGGALLVLTGSIRGEWASFDAHAISLHSALAWLYLVIIGSLVAFPCYVYMLKHSTPARVSTYAYVNPVVAVFLGWLVLGEAVTLHTLVASAVIITAVVIITVQRSKQSATP